LHELQQMYSGMNGRVFKTCKKCHDRRRRRTGVTLKPSGVGLDGCYDTHEEFVEAVTSFLEQHDSHVFDSSLPSLRTKATPTSTFLIDNDISVKTCTQTSDQDVQKRAAVLLRNVMFDCTGYFFHIRRVNVKPDVLLH
ncbi:hypothetical protein V1523DRAFT_355188, partial [Lipomyces doorenjongii]